MRFGDLFPVFCKVRFEVVVTCLCLSWVGFFVIRCYFFFVFRCYWVELCSRTLTGSAKWGFVLVFCCFVCFVFPHYFSVLSPDVTVICTMKWVQLCGFLALHAKKAERNLCDCWSLGTTCSHTSATFSPTILARYFAIWKNLRLAFPPLPPHQTKSTA